MDRIAEVVTARPLLVTLVVLAGAATFGSQLPPERDPAPEKLLASAEDDQVVEASEFRSRFQNTDKVLVLLLEHPDGVLRPGPVRYLHALSRHFENQDFIERALSVTTMPLPRSVPEDDEISFDDLLAEDDEPEAETNPELVDALHLLVNSDPDNFPEGFGALASRLDSMIETDAVIEGDEVTDEEIEELASALDRSPLIEGRLISEDRSVAVVVFSLVGNEDGEVDHEAVAHAMEAIEAYVAEHPAPDGASVHFSGLPAIRLAIADNIRRDNIVLIPATLVVCMFLLFLSFRWLPGVFFPIVAAGVLVLYALGGMAVFGEPMNVINNIIPPLLIIIGITDAIHLIQRYREEYRRKGDALVARKIAIRAMGVAVLLTSLTTSVGLASLVVSKTGMLQRFGVIAAIGVMIAYLITITILPAMLSWAPPPPAPKDKKKRVEWLERVIVLTTRWVLRRSKAVLVATLALLAGLVYIASNVNIDHRLLDAFQPESSIYQATRLMEDKLDGVRPLDVQITADEDGVFLRPETVAAIDEVSRWAEARPEVLSTMSYSNILHELMVLLTDRSEARDEGFVNAGQLDALSQLVSAGGEQSPVRAFLSEDGRSIRLAVKVSDAGAKRTLELIDELDTKLQETLAAHESGYDGDFRIVFSGDAYLGSRGLRAVITDLLGSLGTAVVIIFVLLILLFRDFRLACLSIPPYVIPLMGTMAYMVVRGIPLNATTVIIFSISIGLAVDGSIHVLQRFREEMGRGRTSGVALLRSARGTGRAIAVSSFTLMLGFGVMMFSSFVPVQHFGELIAVTIFACLLSTIVVQPALLQVAGKRRR